MHADSVTLWSHRLISIITERQSLLIIFLNDKIFPKCTICYRTALFHAYTVRWLDTEFHKTWPQTTGPEFACAQLDLLTSWRTMTSNTTFNVYHPQASKQGELYRVSNACWWKRRTFAMGVLRVLPENGVPLSQTGRVLIQTTEQKERDTV